MWRELFTRLAMAKAKLDTPTDATTTGRATFREGPEKFLGKFAWRHTSSGVTSAAHFLREHGWPPPRELASSAPCRDKGSLRLVPKHFLFGAQAFLHLSFHPLGVFCQLYSHLFSYGYNLRPASLENRFGCGSNQALDTPTAGSGGILASPRTACRGRSYTRSTSALRLGMPYRDEYSYSFVSDVFGRIMISVMANATSGTGPKTI
jgi:hypothetical protein